MNENKEQNNCKVTKYSIDDVMKVTNDIFNLNKEKNYNPGAFVHGLVFALEVSQQNFKIPQQQMAEIKRGCRKYFSEILKNKIS
jgi:hypothetical protein